MITGKERLTRGKDTGFRRNAQARCRLTCDRHNKFAGNRVRCVRQDGLHVESRQAAGYSPMVSIGAGSLRPLEGGYFQNLEVTARTKLDHARHLISY